MFGETICSYPHLQDFQAFQPDLLMSVDTEEQLPRGALKNN
jgi:hypothetical protein